MMVGGKLRGRRRDVGLEPVFVMMDDDDDDDSVWYDGFVCDFVSEIYILGF